MAEAGDWDDFSYVPLTFDDIDPALLQAPQAHEYPTTDVFSDAEALLGRLPPEAPSALRKTLQCLTAILPSMQNFELLPSGASNPYTQAAAQGIRTALGGVYYKAIYFTDPLTERPGRTNPGDDCEDLEWVVSSEALPTVGRWSTYYKNPEPLLKIHEALQGLIQELGSVRDTLREARYAPSSLGATQADDTAYIETAYPEDSQDGFEPSGSNGKDASHLRVRQYGKACESCHNRKVKCSGEYPCDRCTQLSKKCKSRELAIRSRPRGSKSGSRRDRKTDTKAK